MSAERILYPCYFDVTLTRREGRRIAKNLGVKSPELSAVETILQGMKVPHRVEERHHPARWAQHEGRIVAEWEGSKGDLIRKVASGLARRK
ncbi:MULTISPECIES: signal recognition particle subunit SRP19/SEC65 family protein [unclassified Methanoculleus]|jgi:signal recognition particle subunit SRP19|uniref:Signal recognition particle 19 kDa protein n=1 Tax=Methanoculleus palmolei TaxID=72612 RepID=A0ABD8A6J5_9EURY|nr:signal recognition particle subunit SRP19/SEC65 family protein [Methanoculleus sp. UBA377]WOX55163.1 signal recognition particle subunit SRP19/SEC65 family protein [Methanoculleus palmolei]